MRRTSIGYVFQDFNLIPALTAAENVALPRELDGQAPPRRAPGPRGRRSRRSGIGDLADRFPDEMSGGQQQRVAIARAIVGERRLILADEPTGALDSETGEDILRLLRARCDAGAAGVLVTHEARHAAWADRVVFLRDGVIVDESGADRPDALLEQARDESRLAGWRLALRLAWREAWRAKGRSALVLVMVTFPVVAVVAADVAQATSSVSSVEGLDRRIGSAQALVTALPHTRQVFQAADPDSGGLMTTTGGQRPAVTWPSVEQAASGSRAGDRAARRARPRSAPSSGCSTSTRPASTWRPARRRACSGSPPGGCPRPRTRSR